MPLHTKTHTHTDTRQLQRTSTGTDTSRHTTTTSHHSCRHLPAITTGIFLTESKVKPEVTPGICSAYSLKVKACPSSIPGSMFTVTVIFPSSVFLPPHRGHGSLASFPRPSHWAQLTVTVLSKPAASGSSASGQGAPPSHQHATLRATAAPCTSVHH